MKLDRPPVDINCPRFQLGLKLMEQALVLHDQLFPEIIKAKNVDWKANQTEVTELDLRIEGLWRQEITRSFVEDGILGEEEGTLNALNDYRWYIDPIDGTRSLARGVPLYGPMLALEKAGVIQWSIIIFPGIRSALSAIRNKGVWFKDNLNDDWAKGSMSSCENLEQALIVSSGPEYFARAGMELTWNKLSHASMALRTWGDCYGYYLFATGRAEIVTDGQLKPWDLAPVRIIGEEFGAEIIDWHWGDGERGLLMGNKKLVAELKEKII